MKLTTLDELRLDGLLGRGGSAEVWRAWHPDRAEPVAVKRVAPAHRGVGQGAAPDLRAEAEALARIRHPGVVGLLEVVDDPPGVALVLEHLAGGSLREVLTERGTLSPGEVVAVLEPIAEAGEALARAGLVHADLKPEHLCFTSSGAPVLVDLGSACAPAGPSVGARSATPAYLAPEVAAGRVPGPRSEVFALAAVAYEALTGRRPHRGEAAYVLALAAAGSHRSLHSWPAVPAAVADAVERGLDPDPEVRPSSPVEFVAALRAAVADHEVLLPGPCRAQPLARRPPAGSTDTLRFGPAPPAEVTARPRGRRRRGLVALVASGVGLALGCVAVANVVRGLDVEPGPHHPAPPAERACPVVAPPRHPGAVHRGDVDGDGCADVARWDGVTLVIATTAGLQAFKIGSPGSQLVLGDWDGDGVDAPALYDPTSGIARLVDRLPGAVGEGIGPSRVQVLPRGGRAVAEIPAAGVDGPDRLRVVDR